MVRYYGSYSSRSREERIKAGVLKPGDQPASSAVPPEVIVLYVSDHQPRRVPSKTWRELIRRIWEVDPLSCPRYAHEMKIISLINDPKIIERIPRHLRLWSLSPDPHEGKAKAPADGPVVMEDFDEGWHGYEEPVLVSH